MRTRRTGFTLVELLVVIGIIALLASILIATLLGVRSRMRLTQCQNNIRQVVKGCINWSTRASFRNLMPPGPPMRWPLNYQTGAGGTIRGQTNIWDGGASDKLRQPRNHGFAYKEGDVTDPEQYYCPDEESVFFSNSTVSGILDPVTGADRTIINNGLLVESSYAYRTSLYDPADTSSFRPIDLERDGSRQPVLADKFTRPRQGTELYTAHDRTRYSVGYSDGRVAVFEDPDRNIFNMAGTGNPLAYPTSQANFRRFEDNPGPGITNPPLPLTQWGPWYLFATL